MRLLAGIPATQTFGIYWESPRMLVQGCPEGVLKILLSFTAGLLFQAAQLALYLGSMPSLASDYGVAEANPPLRSQELQVPPVSSFCLHEKKS